jgi:CheY-like chemotaxis protein/predicted transcriptional regulator
LINKNSLGSFSLDVANRMLDILNEHGRGIKKTNLASKAGLNYNVCLRYIEILNGLEWVDVNSEVRITEIGKGVHAKLVNISQARASAAGDNAWPGNVGEKRMEYSWSSYISLLSQTKPPSMVTDEKQKQAVSQSKQKAGNKNSIMIVDDEEDVALIYEDFLSSVGYNVRTFIESRSALLEYVSNPFLYDLLVLDIRMRDISGFQLYQSVKAINPECRAIFVSALDTAREVVTILPGMKPKDIIQKPVSKEQFVTAVKKALVQ